MTSVLSLLLAAATLCPQATPCVSRYWLENKQEPRLQLKHEEIRRRAVKEWDCVLLGDSVTHFWEIHNGTPYFNRHLRDGWKILNLGFGGDCTQHTLWNLQKEGYVDGCKVKMFTLLIGNNNIGEKATDEDLANVAQGCRRILDVLRESHPESKVVLFPLLPKGNEPGVFRTLHAKYNALIRAFADGERVIWAGELWDAYLATADANGVIPKSVFCDGCHPGLEGYRIWGEILRKYLVRYCGPRPDSSFSPGYFWMWNAKLDVPKLVAQLEDMHAHGLSSVCVHPFPVAFRKGTIDSSMEPDYLTPAFVDAYARVVRRARELGMEMWLYDEGGWPSGGACGLVAKGDPEGCFSSRILKVASDGATAVASVPYAGNPPKPSLIEKGAVDRFLALTHEAYAKALPGDLGQTVRFAFTDEPDMPPALGWPADGLGWTADFGELFRTRFGYDLEPFAGELIARRDETDDRLAKMRIDYLELRARLMCERFLLPVRDWCRAHGMISGGHLNNEDRPDVAAEYGHGHGDLMRDLRALDCPGVDVIWRQLFPGAPGIPARTGPFPRYAASAMHQNGGRFALSETFGIFGDSCTPDQMKWLVDYQLVRGINRFVFGYFNQSNAGQWRLLFEPHSGPVAPYWDFEPAYFRYIERTAACLSLGRPATEIAVLFDVRGIWAGGADREAAVRNHFSVAQALDRMNRDYDFVNDDSLASAEVGKDGALRVGAMAYRALVLPTSKWLSAEARAKVEAFRRAGGLVTDGTDLAALPVTLKVSGRGAAELRVLKRVDGLRTIYFVVNEGPEPVDATLSFAEPGPVSRYDVDADELKAVAADSRSVSRHFDAFGSEILFVTADIDATAERTYARTFGTLADGWTFRRTVSHGLAGDDFAVRPVEEPFRPIALGDWRPVIGDTFCGRGVYRTEIESDRVRDVQVDLGQVRWCAGLRVNGTDCGKRFFGPYRWEVRLEKGRNVVEVEIANLMSALLGDRAVRQRLAAERAPSPYYELHQGPADLLNREGGLYGPVVVREADVNLSKGKE